MAVKSAKAQFKTWNLEHYKRLAKYNARIEKLLNQAIANAIGIVSRHGVEASDKPFSFSDDRQVKAEADKIMKELSREITALTQQAEGEEWKRAYEQSVGYIGELYKVALQSKYLQDEYAERLVGMKTRNLDALGAFQKRKIGGMNLSGRIWEYTEDFQRQMEVSIDTALLEGKSAHKLALSVQELLKNPDALFRRVRDENDELRMSKAMEAYHPGPGRYRSAYKNAMRLARSEINMAYRASDSQTAQEFDCVVGIRVNLSNNHTCNGEPFVDICDELSDQNYPKDFVFTGWHPQCRCYITYILKTDEEFWADLEAGENNESVNTVNDVPDAFKEWVLNNDERISRAEGRGTLPYFLRDNKGYLESVESGLDKRITFARLVNEPSWDVRCMDIFMSNEDIENWFEQSPYSKLDITSFNMSLNEAFRQYGIDPSIVAKSIDLDPNANTMKMMLLFERDGKAAQIVRNFTPMFDDDGRTIFVVEHSTFSIPKSMQGGGFSRSILSAFYDQYKRMGIDRIDLYANMNVGGYAWARYGMSITNGKEGLDALLSIQSIGRKDKFSEARGIIDSFYETHEETTPFPMNLLTGHPWSKDLLLGSDWYGFLNLNSKKQVAIFENYLKH
ncbi:MAG: hypothetical protein K6G25_06510 [Bacteroidales bacterium]|nr:hypothetical protein [Bacteroidales bacterium]